MSYKFKVGDEVVLAVGGKCGEEGREWWREEGMQVGNTYKVRAIDQDHISVVSGKFWHHPDHFVLASEYTEEVEAAPPVVIEVGDTVRVKSWEEQLQLERFNIDNDNLPAGWVEEMVELCGKVGKVVDDDGALEVDIQGEPRTWWIYSHQMELVVKESIVPDSETPLEAPEASVDEATQLEQPAEAPSPVSEAIKSDGGSSSYYTFIITNAKGESMEVETGDVIRAMVGNDFDFGNCVKALRRMYLAKNGKGGKMGVDVAYDANKIRWFVDQIEKR